MTTPTVTSRVPTDRVSTVIHLGTPRSILTRAVLLLGEVVAVPGVLLYVSVTAGHAALGLAAVFTWRAACIGARRLGDARVPTTCWFAFVLFVARTIAGIAVSSVSIYLLIPALMCAAQSLVFLASALSSRPLLMRLATDYTDEIPDRRELRRLFAQLSALWGGVHLLCAGLGIWALTLSPAHAVAVTSALSLACTLGSGGGCLAWMLWRAARIPGLRVVCRERPAAETHHVAVPARALPQAA